jgi:basic membrane protein A
VNLGDPPPASSPDTVVTSPILGLSAAARDLGVKTSVIWQGRFERAAKSSDLVFLGVTPFEEVYEAFARLARRYPQKRFVVPETITPDSPFVGLRNVTGISFDDHELGYLAGYLAALMVRPHQTISAVGGISVQSVRDLIAGYRAGARDARSSVHVLSGYTGTFVDQPRCERLANRQIDEGSKVVFDVAGDCGFGAMQAAQIRGVWGLGVDSDLSYLGPQILASAVKRFDRATEAMVAYAVQGKLPRGGNVTLNLGNDAIGLVGISDRVPGSVRRKLEQVAAKLRARDELQP